MLCIFDQQKGTLAELGVMLDCVVSLLRQWVLRPHIETEPASSPLRGSPGHQAPSFEIFEPSEIHVSAMIAGTLLSMIFFYTIVVAIPYSWIHVLNLRYPFAGRTGALGGNSNGLSVHLQEDVIPTESEGFQRNSTASSYPHTAAARVRTGGETIWLDRYVGQYISKNPPVKVSIQIEEVPLSGNRLSLSLATAAHSGLALSPVSPTRFVIIGTRNGYVDFTADAQGTFCCLSLAVNGTSITAQRQ